MRLYEFNSRQARVVSLISQLKAKAGKNETAKVRTDSFMSMLKNMGIPMSVDGLNSMVSNDAAVQRNISSVDDNFITLNMTGDVADDDFGDDFDLGGMDDEGDVDLGIGGDEMGDEEVGATTDDFDQPEMAGPVQKTDPVDNMAKRALSRRV